MMDIEALSRLDKGKAIVEALPDPPTDYVDSKGLDMYVETATRGINIAVATVQDVSKYEEAIMEKLDSLQLVLGKATEKVQEHVKKVLNNLQTSDTIGRKGAQMKSTSSNLGARIQIESDPSEKILEYTQKMQELEKRKQILDESILKTKVMIEKVRKGIGVTLKDVETLKGTIDNWRDANNDSLIKEPETIFKSQEQKESKEEERRKKEEEEKNRIEQERVREERKEEEEQRDREEEARQLTEEERLKKEREEEEKRQRDPTNWKHINYKRSDGRNDAYHQGVCCQVSTMKGTLDEDDLECNASDEWREDVKLLALGEKPASSLVRVEAKSGRKTLPVPMHVSIPYSSVYDSSDEVVLRVSVNDGQWEEQEQKLDAFEGNAGLRMKRITVGQFKKMKLLAVVKPKRQNVVVDKSGVSKQSSVDNRVKLIIPKDTFDKSTSVKLVVLPIEENSLSCATKFYEHCQHIQSTSSIIDITCEERPKKEIQVQLAKLKKEDAKQKVKTGMLCHVYKGRDGQWKVPQVQINSMDSSVSISLPSGEDKLAVLELEFSRGTRKEHFIKTAEELCYHAHATIARVIAKQKAENPSMLMIQCVSSKEVPSRLNELKKLGYTIGPDVSKEFPIENGQTINFKGSGNISMSAGSSQQIQLTFHDYMDSAKHETTLNVVDKYGQLDLEAYTGQLHFNMPEKKMGWMRVERIDGFLPLTMPKTDTQLPRHLTLLAKFLAYRLTGGKGKDWREVLLNLGLKDKVDEVERKADKADPKPEDERYIFEIVLREWMKLPPLNEDKVRPIMASLAKINRTELVDESAKVIYIHEKLLSDEHVSKMASLVTEDWVALALYLRLSDADIESCKCSSKKDPTEEAQRMWRKWRISEKVAQSGSNVMKDLISTLDSLSKYNQLKNFLKGLIPKK